MARGTLTLYDVPAEVRAKGAAEARKTFLQMLTNPHLSMEQRADIQERLQWCGKWESLNIEDVIPRPVQPSVPPPATSEPPQGNNHVVELSESLSIEEG